MNDRTTWRLEQAEAAERLESTALRLDGELESLGTTSVTERTIWLEQAKGLTDLAHDLVSGVLSGVVHVEAKAAVNRSINLIRSRVDEVVVGNASPDLRRGLAVLATAFAGIASRLAPPPAVPLKDGTGRIVWVLGAGFSKPLGGPLLCQLLSPGSLLDLRMRYGKDHPVVSHAATWACHVYHYGRAYATGRLDEPISALRGEDLWSDAEEFIDLLDSATKHQNAGQTIERVVNAIKGPFGNSIPSSGSGVEEMRDAARRVLAAECNAFTIGASLAQERWSAHVDWAKRLDGRHTVITFNYDRALERLRGHIREELGTANAGPTAILPGDDVAASKFAGQAIALKLHGSIDWCRSDDAIECSSEREYALAAPAKQAVLATPGPTKADVTEDLEPLWKLGERRIQDADSVVFVGYRFPPTDAVARKRILKAIEERGRCNARPLALHVVLGPRSQDAARLAELLHHAARHGGLWEDPGSGVTRQRTYKLRVHELYSQDFFTVYDEALILP